MSTYTYVSYCTDQSEGMPELKEAYHKLAADLERRKDAMDPRAADAFGRRIENLRLAWALLLEPVPKPYGG